MICGFRNDNDDDNYKNDVVFEITIVINYGKW